MELNILPGPLSDEPPVAAPRQVVPLEAASNADQPVEPQPNVRDRGNTDLLARFQNWWQNDAELDVLEQSLQSYLTTTSDPAARRLLRDYTRLKSTPSGELFNFLLAFQTPKQSEALSDYDRLDLETNLPLKSCLDQMRMMLQRPDPPSLQICTFISVIPDDIRIGEQSFVSKLFASTKALTSMREAPLLAISNTIQSDWKLPPEVRDISQNGSRVPNHGRITIPSQGKSQKLFPLQSSEWTTITFSWLRDVFEYTQDVAIYVWQPHLSPLLTVGASITISPGNLGPHQVLVVLRPSKSGDNQNLLEKLKSSIPDPVKDLKGDEIEITSTALSIYSLLISDTCFLVERLLTLVDRFAQTGRRNPSVSKIHYTLYLTDCQTHAQKSLLNALEQLSTYSSTDASVVDWIARIEKDLNYLQLQLVEIDSKIGELRNAIKAQLDLRQIRLSRLLTVLAAIYLPFSFVSGFFGMNLSSPLWKNSGSGQKSSTSSSLPSQSSLFNTIYEAARKYQVGNIVLQSDESSSAPNLTLLSNQTEAIISAVSTTQYYFTLKQFLIVAFSLTFGTIILPLIAGDIFRILIQFSDRYKGHWRILVLVLGLAFVITFEIFHFETQYPYIFTFGVPQVMFALYILYRTRCRNKHWIAYAGILSTSIGYDLEGILINDNFYPDDYPFLGLTGILPLVYLLVQGAAVDAVVLYHPKIPGLKRNLSYFVPRTVRTHPKEWIWALAALWIVFNVGLHFVPDADTIFFAGYSVVLGLYGLGKVIKSWTGGEGLAKWTGFIAVLVLSGACDYYLSYGLALSTVPFFWLICVRFYHNDQAFITRYFPKWINLRKPKSRSMPQDGESV